MNEQLETLKWDSQEKWWIKNVWQFEERRADGRDESLAIFSAGTQRRECWSREVATDWTMGTGLAANEIPIEHQQRSPNVQYNDPFHVDNLKGVERERERERDREIER